MTGGGGFDFRKQHKFFCLSWRPDWLWGLPCFTPTGYKQKVPRDQSELLYRNLPLYIFVLKCLTQHRNSFNFTFCLGCVHTLNNTNDNELCSIIECLLLYHEAYSSNSSIVRFIAVHFLSHVDIRTWCMQHILTSAYSRSIICQVSVSIALFIRTCGMIRKPLNLFFIYIPTNCTQLLFFINNTLKHLYCLKL